MDFSPEFLIDWSLNVAGYVVAGLLSVAIFSSFNRNKKTAHQTITDKTEETNLSTKPVSLPKNYNTNSKLEFIKLGETASDFSQDSTSKNNTNNLTGVIRRNRSEVLRVAREMLNAGASPEKIKSELPVSETELSLLSLNKN